MGHSMRQYYGSDDYWRLRSIFRRRTSQRPVPSGFWHVGLLEYWRWHWLENAAERTPNELANWEDDDGDVIAVLIQGDPGVCHPLIDPEAWSDDLAVEMLSHAEDHLRAPTCDSHEAVYVWSDDKDLARQQLLKMRGYVRHESAHAIESHGGLSLTTTPDLVPPPNGYAVRSMCDRGELPTRSLASWRSFQPGEPDDGADPTGSWYLNIQPAPLYRRDLDVVAVDKTVDIVSCAVCFFDDVTRTGVFVLDGTAAQHQRKGLGKAVMTETLARLVRLGAVDAYVSWYEAPAGALYQSVGFKVQETSRAWIKTW